LYRRSLFSFVLPIFPQARLLISIPENRSRQCTESCCCRSLGPGLGPELELVAIAWYQCWCLCRGAGPSVWIPSLGPGGVVLQLNQVERTRYLCSFVFLFMFTTSVLSAARGIAFTLLEVHSLSTFSPLSLPSPPLYHLTFTNTPPPLSQVEHGRRSPRSPPHPSGHLVILPVVAVQVLQAGRIQGMGMGRRGRLRSLIPVERRLRLRRRQRWCWGW